VGGGMARRHVELCRRFGDGASTMEVSTVSAPDGGAFDAGESYLRIRYLLYVNEGDLLRERSKAEHSRLKRAARLAVETHYNWNRVARDTRDFTYAVAGERSRRK
jgi:hypothetical protein